MSKNFYCKDCDFTCSRKFIFDRHLLTLKHKKCTFWDNFGTSCDTFVTTHETDNKLACKYCSKVYKSRNGLWYHQKKCEKPAPKVHLFAPFAPFSENDTSTVTNIILNMFKQNQAFQKDILEVIKDSALSNNSNNVIMTNTTNNTSNTKFNLNFFLNETCKDAMNLSEFVDTLQITLADLENVGKLGYEEGISRIFTNGLKALDISKRPIHCSDVKREVVYVKNNNIWVKEIDQLRKAIKLITNKNIKLIPKWKEANPGHHLYHNKRNDDYLKIMYESMGPTDEMEEKKSFGKIITNLAKETVIVK